MGRTMKQQIILNNRSCLVSEKAYQKIEAIIEDDQDWQQINSSLMKSMNQSEEKPFNNNLSGSWKLPQQKPLLFSKNS